MEEGQEGQEGREGREGQEGQEGREGQEGQEAGSDSVGRRYSEVLSSVTADDSHPDPGLVRGSRIGLRQGVAAAAGEPATPAGCRTDHRQRALRLGSGRRHIGGARRPSRYLVYVDGAAGVELQDVSCSGTPDAAGFACSARLPPMSPGLHSLVLSAFIEDGDPARKRPLVATERHPRRASDDNARERRPSRAR